ncbi:unnamed protein product [Boreogadus saida]
MFHKRARSSHPYSCPENKGPQSNRKSCLRVLFISHDSASDSHDNSLRLLEEATCQANTGDDCRVGG